jgi:hypothetical protein
MPVRCVNNIDNILLYRHRASMHDMATKATGGTRTVRSRRTSLTRLAEHHLAVHAIGTNREQATMGPHGLTSIRLQARNVEAVVGSHEEFGLIPMRLRSSESSAPMPVSGSRSRAACVRACWSPPSTLESVSRRPSCGTREGNARSDRPSAAQGSLQPATALILMLTMQPPATAMLDWPRSVNASASTYPPSGTRSPHHRCSTGEITGKVVLKP